MAKLKLDPLDGDKPVRLTVELPATPHRDLVAYAEALGLEVGVAAPSPVKLIVPMLAPFIASDRTFSKIKRVRRTRNP